MNMNNYDTEMHKEYRKYKAMILKAKRYEDKIIKKQKKQIEEDEKKAQKQMEVV